LPFHYLKAGNAEVGIAAFNSAVHFEDLSCDVADAGEAGKTTAAGTAHLQRRAISAVKEQVSVLFHKARPRKPSKR
jgi:hypothetical protein